MEEPESAPKQSKPRRASLIKATENIKKVAPKKKPRDEEYEVEAIQSHYVVDGVTIYKVTWVGYPGEITDLLEEDLANCVELLDAYKEKVKASGDFDPNISAVLGSSSYLGNENDAKEKHAENGLEEVTPPSAIKEGSEKQKKNGKTITVTEAKKNKKRPALTMKEAKLNGDGNVAAVASAKRSRKAKRTLAPDAELGYTNGCVVDSFKGFSAKEPVILVSYKEPMPSGFQDKQDEIVPVRLIAEKEPKMLIDHLVELLSVGRGNVAL